MNTDFSAHNAEVKKVWESYHAGTPIRVPMILGTNPRFTMFDHPANPRRITFEQYLLDPEIMLTRQIEHQWWVRHHLPQDAEMGPPSDGWHVGVDFQNTYEAAWFGCRVAFRENQVPDTEPLLQNDDRKRMLFDQGIPDPFGGEWMRRNWDHYEYFQRRIEEGAAYFGYPIVGASPTALGTDGPMTVACNLRGATEFCSDLIGDPDYAQSLLSFITEATIARIKSYRQRLEQPMTTVGWGFADDAIEFLSEQQYKEWIYPHHKRLIEAFSEGGPNSIHLCGDATRHFRFLRDHLNIQSFDTGFPVNFTWLREQLGPEITVAGGPSIALLLNADPDEVRDEVRRILSSGIRAGGRFILREGNNLPPGVPLANLEAMYAACKEFGCYGD